MFVSRAHSFQQQARLAITLAWVGGYTNVVTILTCGTVTSHMTGITSNVGRDISTGDWHPAGFGLFLIAVFFCGSAGSGICTEIGRRRRWESIYVLPMVIEVSMLALFAALLQRIDLQHIGFGHPLVYLMTGLAAFSMGLQNATITKISNGTVRTTHVTGVVTDLGAEVSQFLWWVFDRRRGKIEPGGPWHPSGLRIALLASILGSFAFGAGLATWGYLGIGTHEHFKLGQWVMVPPVMFLLWIIYRDIKRPIADIRSVAGGMLPDGVAIYALHKDAGRNGHVQRMPNLTNWAAGLPADTQIVILDVSQMTGLDRNAAMEIHALATRLTAQDRQLILAGISRAKYQLLSESASGELFIGLDNCCPDLDFALARSLNLLAERNVSTPTTP
jgi:uncharacterized membrane protein YoaK (UPF0700 family)